MRFARNYRTKLADIPNERAAKERDWENTEARIPRLIDEWDEYVTLFCDNVDEKACSNLCDETSERPGARELIKPKNCDDLREKLM